MSFENMYKKMILKVFLIFKSNSCPNLFSSASPQNSKFFELGSLIHFNYFLIGFIGYTK